MRASRVEPKIQARLQVATKSLRLSLPDKRLCIQAKVISSSEAGQLVVWDRGPHLLHVVEGLRGISGGLRRVLVAGVHGMVL